jgi:hypothetical protein
MPCRDYESDNGYSQREEYKQQCDRLARIACAAMEELVKQGKEDFLVLKNPEVAEWWTAHVKADRKEKARIAEIERKERVRAEALARLSDEEKELLGLNPTLKIKGLKRRDVFSFDPSEEDSEYQTYSEGDIKYLYDQLRKK